MPADRLSPLHTSLPRQFWTLFLLCSVPVHLWSILMLLRDYPWVLEQFSFDIFLGYTGYALLAALIESLVVAGLLFILSLLISRKWPQEKRTAVLIAVVTAVSLWALGGQVFFMLRESPPGWFAWVVLRLPFHRTLTMSALWVLVTASITVPVYFILQGSKLERGLLSLLDRLTVLAVFYLVLDGLGLLMVIYRLVRGAG